MTNKISYTTVQMLIGFELQLHHGNTIGASYTSASKSTNKGCEIE